MADERKRDPYDIISIFEQMALDLINSLRRNFKRHKEEEIKEGFRWDRWQLVKLRNMLKYRKTNTKIVRRAVRDAQKLAEDVIQESYQDGQQKAENEIRRLFGTEQRAAYEVSGEIGLPVDEKPQLVKPDYEPGKVPYDQLPKAQPETQFFGMNEKKLDALQETVKNDLQQAEYGVLRKMDDVYRQVIYKAEVNMAAGAKTLEQAVDMATKEFLERGINSITYSDGRKVDISAWAEMALRTASQRATFLGEGKKRDQWGVYTVIMSAHDNCSPWCLPYQGKVLIDDVYTSISPEQAEQLAREHNAPRLSEAMRNGAFHPNCRHTLSTYFPGISRLPEPADDKKALRNYRAEQKQRYIERQIRKYKRLEAGSMDPDNQARYARKVKEWQSRMREHLNAHPELRRSPWREKVEGQISTAERSRVLKESENRAKIEEIRQFIRSDAQPKTILPGQQNKHIPGTNEFKQYEEKLRAKGQYGPSRLTISIDEAQELVNKYAGTGLIKIGPNGEWDRKETIITNDEVVGIAVNNLTGQEAKTTVFRIHYGNKGVHIVPDYPSKKRKER